MGRTVCLLETPFFHTDKISLQISTEAKNVHAECIFEFMVCLPLDSCSSSGTLRGIKTDCGANKKRSPFEWQILLRIRKR